MALEPDDQLDESHGDLLFSSDGSAVPHGCIVEPRYHQPNVFVLLSADPTQARPRCLIVSSTNARYEDWANLTTEEYEAEQAGLDRDDDSMRWRNTFRIAANASMHVEAATPLHVSALHEASGRFEFRHEVRRSADQSRSLPEQIRGPLPCWQRGHYHVRLAGCDQLWRDRGERRGCLVDYRLFVRDGVIMTGQDNRGRDSAPCTNAVGGRNCPTRR